MTGRCSFVEIPRQSALFGTPALLLPLLSVNNQSDFSKAWFCSHLDHGDIDDDNGSVIRRVQVQIQVQMNLVLVLKTIHWITVKRPIRRRELISGSWYSNIMVTFVIAFALVSGLPKFLLSTTVRLEKRKLLHRAPCQTSWIRCLELYRSSSLWPLPGR